MGDVILTTSIIRCLKKQLNCEIDFLTKEAFSPLISKNPHINSVFHFRKPLKENIDVLKVNSYDLIIDLQKNRKSKFISNALGVKTIRFDKLNIKKWILVQTKINLLPEKHLIDRYFDSVKELGVKNDLLGNELFIDSDSQSSVATLNLPKTYISLAIGAQHKGKCMSETQLLSIIHNAPLPVILLGGGEQEVHIADYLMVNSNRNSLVNLVGKTSILELASIIKDSAILISGDTGSMHMASAFKVPQLSVWGCTTPDLGMWPYLASEHSVIIQPEDHTSRPCSKLGNRCKYAPEWCIHSITPERINDTIKLILAK